MNTKKCNPSQEMASLRSAFLADCIPRNPTHVPSCTLCVARSYTCLRAERDRSPWRCVENNIKVTPAACATFIRLPLLSDEPSQCKPVRCSTASVVTVTTRRGWYHPYESPCSLAVKRPAYLSPSRRCWGARSTVGVYGPRPRDEYTLLPPAASIGFVCFGMELQTC